MRMHISLKAARQLGLLPSEWSELDEPVSAIKSKHQGRFEDQFAFQCRSQQLPPLERQLMFARSIGRRWMFDFAFPEYKVAVEIEGLVMRKIQGRVMVMGRHASATGIKGDMVKYNHAALLGWYVLRFPQDAVKPGTAVEMTRRVLETRGWRSP